ncbi:MAG TPA: hypothetical protein VHP58_03515 [Alphaproteobacteria bacterium]|nr:hypothetical protein [Alphaproteobacteria bacterium]
MKRLLLWVILLAASFAPLAQALPCITQTQPTMSMDCMASMKAAGSHEGMASDMMVSDCFKQPALPADLQAVAAPASPEPIAFAILPEVVKPVASLGQQTVRPPPRADTARFTSTQEFLATLSRWLI